MEEGRSILKEYFKKYKFNLHLKILRDRYHSHMKLKVLQSDKIAKETIGDQFWWNVVYPKE